jgi:hypothetical protein
MDAEELFLHNEGAIDRIIAFVAGRYLDPAETEKFASYVKSRLTERNYAILRKFEGRCSLTTYVMVVVRRLLHDYRES